MWLELLDWYQENKRDLPWRRTTNPYYILVSELMLQQTQVDRVIPKYLFWLEQFPDLRTLASASRKDVLSAWSGLGYNSRAARLHTLAKILVSDQKDLPLDEQDLQKLPGIGPYTAGAIRAFAYDKQGLFIDVNVLRVLSRVLYDKDERTLPKHIKDALLDAQEKHSPRKLANALMDLGSKYCRSKNPLCNDCPLLKCCKSKGERSQETKERAKKQQSSFQYSTRWFRGKIIHKLSKKDFVSIQELEDEFIIKKEHKEILKKAIVGLEKDSLITINKQEIRLCE